MLYELERTPNYRFQYGRLNLKLKRFIDEALEIVKQNPKEYQGRISYMSSLKNKNFYRIRIPGAYIHYWLDDEMPIITLTQIRILH